MSTLLVALPLVAVLVGAATLVVARRVHRHRIAQRENTRLRRAARIPPEARVHCDPVLHWEPDHDRGGWRLAGRYLPGTAEVQPPGRASSRSVGPDPGRGGVRRWARGR